MYKLLCLFSRIHQFAKLLLFSPSSGLYSCPLAMTDGAAKLIEVSHIIVGVTYILYYIRHKFISIQK